MTIQELSFLSEIMEHETDILKALVLVYGPNTPVSYILQRIKNSQTRRS